MAGEGIVIDLGSSDEEAGPAPKKVKSSKPIPNAMVHIPQNIRNVTITPVSKKIGSNNNGKTKNAQKGFMKSDKIVAKKTYSPLSLSNVPGQAKANFQKPIRVLNSQIANIPKIPSKAIVNPIGLMKKFNTSQVVINKVTKPTHINVAKPIQINVAKPTHFNVPKIHPNITITKTNGSLKRPNPCISTNLSITKKRKMVNKPNSTHADVVTVELDDEQAEPAGPQWYLRPEELAADADNTEESNNKEPETKTYVEITIEDSPVKQSNKKAAQHSDSLSITIEDSPVKTVKGKYEQDAEENSVKQPPSKKQLQYPTEIENVIEIEVPPMEVSCESIISSATISNEKEESRERREVSQTNNATEQVSNTSPPKKIYDTVEAQNISKESKESTNETITSSEEFHPAYQKFIDLCFELENSDDMKKIVDKKIKTYYKQVPKIYTGSEHFIDMVTSKVAAMKAAPDKMYLFIKDIVDELNLQRKIVKSQITEQDNKKTESDKFLYGEDSEYDTKRQRQIRMLEKTLKKLHRAIQKLEEQEVDFDDEEDSVYLLTDRYKERMVRVHAKLCQLTNTKMPSEPYIHIEARPGQPMGPIKKIEKWINKKVPVGKPLPFPDFHDVLRCVRESNEEDQLGWNEAIIMEQARDLFTRCGKKLQRRRQENEWRLAFSRISVESDPAEKNEQLKKQLEDNLLRAAKKESEIFNRFADKQNQLKLEAEEINEVDGSSDESEDEDVIADDTSLKTKEKRKERLKRLIEEKSKKNERSPSEESTNNKVENVVESCPSIDDSTQNTQQNIDCVEITADKETDDIAGSVHTLSDDSILASDVDELHLLKKLHSENESNSSDSSDIEFCTDVLSSASGNNSDDNSGDIISIENSSYSESETNEKQKDRGNTSEQCLKGKVSNQPPDEPSKENTLDETIMALSDDENIASVDSEITCVNLNDVTIIDADTIEIDTDDLKKTVPEITAVSNESQKHNKEIKDDTNLKQSYNKDFVSEVQRSADKSTLEQECILDGSSIQDKSKDIVQLTNNENMSKTIEKLGKNEIFDVEKMGIVDNKQKKDDHVQSTNNENESEIIEKVEINEILDHVQKGNVDDCKKHNDDSVQLTNNANEYKNITQLEKNKNCDVQKGNIGDNKQQKDVCINDQPESCRESENVLTQDENIDEFQVNMFEDMLLAATDNDDIDDNLDQIEMIMTLEEDSTDNKDLEKVECINTTLEEDSMDNKDIEKVECINNTLEICKNTDNKKLSSTNDNNSQHTTTNVESQECVSANPGSIEENLNSNKQDVAGNDVNHELVTSASAIVVENVKSNIPEIAGNKEKLESTCNNTGLREDQFVSNPQKTTGGTEIFPSAINSGVAETNLEIMIKKTADNKVSLECATNSPGDKEKNIDSNTLSCLTDETNELSANCDLRAGEDETRNFEKNTLDISV